MFKVIKNSIKSNPSLKGKIILVSFNIMRIFRPVKYNKINSILFFPIYFIYKFITSFLFKCEIPCSTRIGRNLVIHHVTGLVINRDTVIGDNVVLNHNTTIGNKVDLKGHNLGSPVIGNNVKISPNSIIIGPIKIGNNVIIGGGSVVVKDVPSNVVIAGNPARIIKYI